MVANPNEDSEPHVQFILRWVFIRKGVGASAQTGVRLSVYARRLITIIMKYFKPAAGIIILVFVLLILFIFIQSSMEESQRQTRMQEQVQAARNLASNYDFCLEAAESDRGATQSRGRTELRVQTSNGSRERMVSNCIANNPSLTSAFTDVDTIVRQTVRNNCDSAVSESILSAINATPEQIEASYQLDVRACSTKYGR